MIKNGLEPTYQFTQFCNPQSEIKILSELEGTLPALTARQVSDTDYKISKKNKDINLVIYFIQVEIYPNSFVPYNYLTTV